MLPADRPSLSLPRAAAMANGRTRLVRAGRVFREERLRPLAPLRVGVMEDTATAETARVIPLRLLVPLRAGVMEDRATAETASGIPLRLLVRRGQAVRIR